jgi:tetratricopeptide (TPR) repeat protein
VLLILVGRLTNVGTDQRMTGLQEAISIAERIGQRETLAAAWAVYALAAMDDATEALAAAEHAIELAAEVRSPLTLAWALNTAATELVRLRRFDEAEQLLDRHCVAGTARFGAHEGHILFQRGRLAMSLGDLETAKREFSAGEEATTRTRSLSGLCTSWYGLAEVARLSGDIRSASAGYRRCLPIDLVLEPAETGLLRMMIVWTACLLGDVEAAEHHTAVLVEERDLERAVASGDTMIAAVAAGAEGLLALHKGMPVVASVILREAVGLWAVSHSWDVVADLIDRLPELGEHAGSTLDYHALAAGVRDGSIELAEAVAMVQQVTA